MCNICAALIEVADAISDADLIEVAAVDLIDVAISDADLIDAVISDVDVILETTVMIIVTETGVTETGVTETGVTETGVTETVVIANKIRM